MPINPKNQEYVNNRQRVTSRQNKGWGEGTIIAIQGSKYKVKFDSKQIGEKMVEANILDLVEDKKEAPNVPVAPATEQGPVPTQLELTSSLNRWNITLLDVSGGKLAEALDVVAGDVKSYVNHKNQITQTAITNLKPGTYPLKKTLTLENITGRLKESYLALSEERKANEKLKQLSEERVKTRGENIPVLSQGAIMTRLLDLHDAKRTTTESGHNSVIMTKIKIDDEEVFLSIGGKSRQITHLYTQVGDMSLHKTEIRCYLGNAAGAYQRVHTSLTRTTPETGEEPGLEIVIEEEKGNKTEKKYIMAAHTMVQTGEKIVVPGWTVVTSGSEGTRIGFDSVQGKEWKTQGFRDRDLTIRSTEQTAVVGSIKAENFNSLTEAQRKGCNLLARSFNEALDKVCADVSVGTSSTRDVTGITQDFTVLDEEWVFPSLPEDGEKKRYATPEREWEHHEKAKEEKQTK